MTAISKSRSERVDLRMTPAAKRTLTEAAASENKTLTEFLLDRGLQAAYDTLADRRTFVLDGARWDAFVTALDHPPSENPPLRQLLARPSPWKA